MSETEAAETAISVRGVSKTFRIYRQTRDDPQGGAARRRRGVYEEFTAVDDVSFTVPKGEALGIFGRNGSGKSTMLKMLARILEPDAGSIEVKGRVAALLEVGAGFHPEYSAIENIFLSGAIYGMSREQLGSRVDDIIAFAQLERFADNPVKTYSSGMYARLGFAIAVNVDPDVLLVDEVLAVGDESFRSRCYERMLAFREAGKTLILVTHDLGAIASFCSRAIWLDEGKIRGEDTPEAITRRYVAEVTAQEELWSAQQAAAGRGLVTFHQPINDTVPISLHLDEHRGRGRHRARRLPQRRGDPRPRALHGAQARALADRRGRAASPRRHARDRDLSTRTGEFDPGDVLEGEGYVEWDDRRSPADARLVLPLAQADRPDRSARARRAGALVPLPGARRARYLETGGATILPSTWSHVRTRDGVAAPVDVGI